MARLVTTVARSKVDRRPAEGAELTAPRSQRCGHAYGGDAGAEQVVGGRDIQARPEIPTDRGSELRCRVGLHIRACVLEPLSAQTANRHLIRAGERALAKAQKETCEDLLSLALGPSERSS